MRYRFSSGETLLAAAVLIHFGVSAVHGFAHARANVTMSAAAMAFVFAVILIGPIVALVVQRFTAFRREGAWAIAGMLAAALAFGLINHFVLTGADHVTHVAKPWRAIFGTTAALLAVTEAFGAVVAVWCATRDDARSAAESHRQSRFERARA
jgi:uncharacterized membrane protein YhaH (DUF805 family)